MKFGKTTSLGHLCKGAFLHPAWLPHTKMRNMPSIGSQSPQGVFDVAIIGAGAAAVENTLFFAGEATDTDGHWGTVETALSSGERVAREILDGRTKRKRASAMKRSG